MLFYFITQLNKSLIYFIIMKEKNRNRRVCPVENAKSLDNVFRKLAHNPKRLLKNYIREGMSVLDVGCGPGFFSIEMAAMVGKTGKVIAADLQEGMLEKVKSKIKGKEIEKHIVLHKCTKNKIGLSENIDFALAFYMVHEVPDQKKFFREIKSILKPGGKIFIIEPRFHVSEKAFENTIGIAKETGFKPVKRENVFLSRAVVLGN